MFDFFKKMFSEKDDGPEPETFRDAPMTREVFRNSASKSQVAFRAASCQSSGRERSHNEDTLFTFSTFMAGVKSPRFLGVFLVADGMGGHQSGEVASHLATQGAGEFLLEAIFRPMLFEHETFEDDELRKMVKEAVDAAQSLIQQNVPGGGTTLTLVLIVDDRIFSGHVGDSRLYVLDPEGGMTVRTRDHSLVKRLVDLGQITEHEASVHPQRNVLYRALGQTEPFEADVDQFSLAVGERLMICSDGLWGPVSARKMEEIFLETDDLNLISCQLVDAANEAGGPDNISVVLVERIA